MSLKAINATALAITIGLCGFNLYQIGRQHGMEQGQLIANSDLSLAVQAINPKTDKTDNERPQE